MITSVNRATFSDFIYGPVEERIDEGRGVILSCSISKPSTTVVISWLRDGQPGDLGSGSKTETTTSSSIVSN